MEIVVVAAASVPSSCSIFALDVFQNRNHESRLTLTTQNLLAPFLLAMTAMVKSQQRRLNMTKLHHRVTLSRMVDLLTCLVCIGAAKMFSLHVTCDPSAASAATEGHGRRGFCQKRMGVAKQIFTFAFAFPPTTHLWGLRLYLQKRKRRRSE